LDGLVAFGRLNLRTRVTVVSALVVLLMAGLGYRDWQVQQENAARMELKAKRTGEGKNLGREGGVKIHTLQVAAFPSSKQASRLVDSLTKKGIRGVYQVKSKNKSGGNWYKIRIGRFESKEDARRLASQLIDQKSIKNYFIISLAVN
jgi:cell division protein FtsN